MGLVLAGGGSAPLPFRRRFVPVLLLGLAGVAALALQAPPPAPPELAGLPPAALSALLLVNPLLLVALSAAVGAALAHRVGLGSLVAGTAPRADVPRVLALAAAGGLGLGLALAALDTALAPSLGIEWETLVERPRPAWPELAVGLLYGGLAEEVLMRWGLMSLAAWALLAVLRRGRRGAAQGLPSGIAVAAIVLAATVFALGHLPALALQIEPTPAIVARTLVLNLAGGLLYGALFWRVNLEAAMAAHAATHVGMTTWRSLVA